MHVTTETAFRIARGSGLSNWLLGVHNIPCQEIKNGLLLSVSKSLRRALLELPVMLKHLLRVPQNTLLAR